MSTQAWFAELELVVKQGVRAQAAVDAIIDKVAEVRWRELREADEATFLLMDDNTGSGPSIVCLPCGRRSFNPTDIRQRYCGRCHRFHDPELLREVARQIESEHEGGHHP